MNPLLLITALTIHVVHTALGLPALEGIEQAIMSPGLNISYIKIRR